jgi:hypothetical protein
MPRNMSFALTPTQYRDGSKDVTRRNGWDHVRVGEILNGVNKAMGFKKGERPVYFGQHQVLSKRKEPLRRMIDDLEYGRAEVIREGFPDLTPEKFVEMYCTHNHCTPEKEVNRIEFRRL